MFRRAENADDDEKQMEETGRYLPPERDWKVVGINLLRVSEVHSITVVSMHNRMSTNNLEPLQRALV